MKSKHMSVVGAAALLALAAASAQGAFYAQITDTSTWSGDPSSVLTVSVGGQDLTSGEIVGLYQFNNSFWGICLSPWGLVDYAKHSYGFEQSPPALNSPAFVPGGLAAAESTFEAVLPGITTKEQAWALFGAVYTEAFGATVSFTPQGVVDGLPAIYAHDLSERSRLRATVMVPNPPTGQGTAGQQFLVDPVPDGANTMAALGAAFALVGVLRHKRKV